MITEGLGGPCPRCDYEPCFIRYGTGTWFAFIACPSCGFAYGENSDIHDETNGVVTGSYVFIPLMEMFDVSTLDELREKAESHDEWEDNTVFDLSDRDQLFLDCCVAQPEVISEIGHSISKDFDTSSEI